MNKISLLLLVVGCVAVNIYAVDMSVSSAASRVQRVGGPGSVWHGDQGLYDIYLKVGDTKELSFASNPSTGYSWKTTVSPQRQGCIKVENKFEAVNAPAGMVGVGGKKTWIIKAIQPGKAKIEFTYQRLWEPKATPDKTYTFFVTR